MSNKQKFTHYIFLVIEVTAGTSVAGLIVYSIMLAFNNL